MNKLIWKDISTKRIGFQTSQPLEKKALSVRLDQVDLKIIYRELTTRLAYTR